MHTGYEVHVAAPKDSFSAKLISLGTVYHSIPINNHGASPIADIKLTVALTRLYKKIKPDLIFHYTIKPNIYGSIASYFSKSTSILITTGLGHLFDFKNGLVQMITIFLYKMAARLSKEVWFLNENDRDIFIYKGVVDRQKTKVIKSEGIDIEHFKLLGDKKVYQPLSFLFAGRLIKDKGVEIFVKAARAIRKEYPDIQFNILGFIDENNPNSISYDQLTRWQGKKYIVYLGETDNIKPFIEKASCLVFPSFYREGISRILMEAASMETPIVTTDNVGCREVVDHGKNGFLCEPQSVSDLVNKLKQFIKLDDTDRTVMGKLGRQKMIREFSERKVIREYQKTIKKFVSTTKKRAINPEDALK